ILELLDLVAGEVEIFALVDEPLDRAHLVDVAVREAQHGAAAPVASFVATTHTAAFASASTALGEDRGWHEGKDENGDTRAVHGHCSENRCNGGDVLRHRRTTGLEGWVGNDTIRGHAIHAIPRFVPGSKNVLAARRPYP